MSLRVLVTLLIYVSGIYANQRCTIGNVLSICRDVGIATNQPAPNTIEMDCYHCEDLDFVYWWSDVAANRNCPNLGSAAISHKGVHPHQINCPRNVQGEIVQGRECKYKGFCGPISNLILASSDMNQWKEQAMGQGFDFNDKKRTIFGNKIVTLYHATKKSVADDIQGQIGTSGSGRKIMRLGKYTGHFGAGIYFAATPDKAAAKAGAFIPPTNVESIVEARVFLGKVKTVPQAEHKYDFLSLQLDGFDSIECDLRNYDQPGQGLEYVVYNKDQVVITRVRPLTQQEQFTAFPKLNPNSYQHKSQEATRKGLMAAFANGKPKLNKSGGKKKSGKRKKKKKNRMLLIIMAAMHKINIIICWMIFNMMLQLKKQEKSTH